MNKKAVAILVLLLPILALAQPELSPLLYNPVLVKQKITPAPAVKKEKALGDTVQLPFFEDFAGYVGYPNPALFSDSNVYVNPDFCIGPPSIGCATFDGLNKHGAPYSMSSTQQGTADSLTSKPINLGGLTAADSVYFSFLYQPQGRGEGVEGNDRLELYFYNNSLGWVRVWYADAAPLDTFKLVMLPITSPNYLYGNFKFQFVSVGAQYGMFDIWNVDYILLDKNRHKVDTTFKDIGFVYKSPALLKDYQHVPYRQWPVDAAKIRLTETNIYKDPINDTYSFFANYNQPACSGTFTDTIEPVYTAGYNNFNAQVQPALDDCVFPPMTGETEYTLTHIFRATNPADDFNHSNDTIVYRQIFSDYYAFDDGTAEASYDINSPNAEGMIKLKLTNPDTLRAVHFYFVQSWNDVQGKEFALVVRKASEADPELPGDSIYFRNALHPVWQDSLNEFVTYYLDDTLLTLPAGQNFFIGWHQHENFKMQVGFDKNIDHSAITYFNLNYGGWTQSPYAGTLMIRPAFGDSIVSAMGIGEPVKATSFNNIKLYPNPASSVVNIANYQSLGKGALQYSLFNLQGAVISSGTTTEGMLDVSGIESGFYIVALRNSKGQHVARKLIITR